MFSQEFDEVMKERRQSPSEEDLMEKIATNPIHAYKMMKRFTVDWKTLQKDLEETDWDEVEFMLKKKKLGTVIPREEDLHGAAQALIRLQDVYELDIRDLSKGAPRFSILKITTYLAALQNLLLLYFLHVIFLRL